MAKAYIEEYSELPVIAGRAVMTGNQPSITTQAITFTTTTASAAFNTNTKFIRISVDAICSYKFGTSSVTATTSNPRMAADTVEFFGVQPGGYVAFVTNT